MCYQKHWLEESETFPIFNINIAWQVLISKKVPSEIRNNLRICLSDIWKAFRICYDALPYTLSSCRDVMNKKKNCSCLVWYLTQENILSTVCTTSRLDVMSFPVDCIFEARYHETLAWFMESRQSTLLLFTRSKVRNLPEVTSRLISKL